MFKRLGVLLIIGVSSMALAKPIVLADFGGRPTELAKMKAIAGAYQTSKESSIYERPTQFPLMSKILSVGVVESQKHKLKVITPVFITGVDQLSLEWLSANQTYLKKIGAKGIVTNIASSSDFEKLKKRVPDLNLNAVPVDQLAEVYGLSHYPVLINKEEISQ